MRLAVFYATRYGTTRDVAEAIARRCADAGVPESEIVVSEIGAKTTVPDAHTIVLGAPTYGGSIPRKMSSFVDANLEQLLRARVGIFLSCLYGGERAEQQLADNFPSRLVAHSFGRYYVGGRVVFSQMRWLDRQIMKRVGGVDHDVDNVDDEEIARLVADVTGSA